MQGILNQFSCKILKFPETQLVASQNYIINLHQGREMVWSDDSGRKEQGQCDSSLGCVCLS